MTTTDTTTPTFTRRTIEVRLSKGARPGPADEIRNVESMCLAGLAYHPTQDHRPGWVVTHIDSGMEVDVFATMPQARAYILGILSFADWTRPKNDIAPGRDVQHLLARMRDVRRDVERRIR